MMPPSNVLTEKTANHKTTVCVLMYSTIINIYVVVNFLSSFVSTSLAYITIAKNRRKTKIN